MTRHRDGTLCHGFDHDADNAPISRRIPIRIVLQVEADPDAWNAEYGDEESDADIREAVRMLALDSLNEATRHLQPGAITSVDRSDTGWGGR